jgi:hypothetical protein
MSGNIVMMQTWTESAEALYQYGQTYGLLQLVFLAALGAITVFRREMSCNHCYAEHESRESAEDRSTTVGSIDWDEEGEGTEDILEGSGLNCSGASLMAVFLSLVNAFSGSDETKKSEFIQKLGRAWNGASIDSTEEVLERAGSFYSGFASLLFARNLNLPTAITISSSSEDEFFANDLPSDVQVNILSFLHPRDVVNFACVSKSAQRVVDHGETATAIWKTLWYRDYAWIVESWDVGRQALRRSAITCTPHFDKNFYFRFGLGYQNYVLAGNSTDQRCLVGLHGHIYDMTPFIMSHPGSPETVMVHAGRDTTAFFNNMRHSMSATRLARSMCVAVDMSLVDRDCCGVRPTSNTNTDGIGPRPQPSQRPTQRPIAKSSQTPSQPPSLMSIRTAFLQEEEHARLSAADHLSDPSVIGEVNVYYDPFNRDFRAWYLTTNLEVIFVVPQL